MELEQAAASTGSAVEPVAASDNALNLRGGRDWVLQADNAEVLSRLPDESFRLVYIDPPFNSGKVQRRDEIATVRCENGDRVGFGGRRYRTVSVGSTAYSDVFDDYLAYIGPRLEQAHRLLSDDGTLYFHIDYREAHYCKVLLDQIFGRACFINEIIWAYDYGGRSRRRWPAKHDTILVYAKDPDRYFFDQDAIERIPYMAPGLVSKEKAARGKLPTDVWWHTIVATNGREKTGYATQKPEGILRRILSASSQENDWVLDFFAGSGTTAAVAQQMNRRFVMIDNNPEAIAVMAQRLGTTAIRYADGALNPLPSSHPHPINSDYSHDRPISRHQRLGGSGVGHVCSDDPPRLRTERCGGMARQPLWLGKDSAINNAKATTKLDIVALLTPIRNGEMVNTVGAHRFSGRIRAAHPAETPVAIMRCRPTVIYLCHVPIVLTGVVSVGEMTLAYATQVVVS